MAGTFDMLVVDVDGYIDRDFSRFFDRIEAEGLIVIDDYRDAVSPRGRKALHKYRRLKRDVAEQKIRNLPSYQRGRLLGKHILAYRLVQRMTECGLLVLEKNLYGTLFCHKAKDAEPFGAVFTAEHSRAVEDSIVNDFLRLLEDDRYHSSGSLRYWGSRIYWHVCRFLRRGDEGV